LIGHIDEGRRVAGEGLELATRRGDLNCMRMALFGLALAERRAGNVSSARAMANEGLEISRRLGDLFFSSYCLWILATAERELGDRDAARVAADEALLHAGQVGAPLLMVCALEVRAAVAVDDSDHTKARALLEQAITLDGQSIVPGSYRSEALRALGQLEAAHGETESATRHLNAALIIAQQVPDPWAEDRARRTLSDVMR
jgi:tetratricopeptide (TPR) repeat protein